jgi:hypothetical protein
VFICQHRVFLAVKCECRVELLAEMALQAFEVGADESITLCFFVAVIEVFGLCYT